MHKRDPNLYVFDHAHKRGYKYHGKPLSREERRKARHPDYEFGYDPDMFAQRQKIKIVLIVVLLTAAWALNGFPMP